MKRSSCASGSGYVPSCSIGFWVASTKNGWGSRCDSPPIVTWRSCIASSKRGLHLGRGAVDLVGEDHVREERAAAQCELPGGLVVDERARDVGREQVRRELDARERQVECARQRGDGERLREPRDALDECVLLSNERDEEPVDEALLPDDDARDLLLDAPDDRVLRGGFARARHLGLRGLLRHGL